MPDSDYIRHLQACIANASDQRAYKELFYHFYPSLRRFANNLTGKPEIAEEIVSDVLLKLWTAREKLILIKDLKLYLFKATKNACLNYINSAVNRKFILTEDGTEYDEVGFNPESEYIYSEVHQLLLSTINGLPPKCQMVFRLVKEFGLNYSQVGQVMQISQNTIETHMRLALKKMKAALDAYQQQ
ncbi:RNA polymerase sigma factor [Niabella insulamsoli]|uniref:RNA polymerase sigma factor n=1 Tax=Niabella insulamsoli TaxID=3144874 RepID=UPI0031FDBFB3